MELALIIAIILLLELAAARWGVDSRDFRYDGFDNVHRDQRTKEARSRGGVRFAAANNPQNRLRRKKTGGSSPASASHHVRLSQTPPSAASNRR